MKYAIYVLFALLVVFAACDTQAEAQAEAEVETSDSDQDDMLEETTQEVEETVSETIDDARQELLSFFDQQQQLRYTVEYDMSAQGQAMTMTQYVDTNGVRVRLDARAQGVETRTIIDDGDVYSCMNMDGWSCFEASMDDAEDVATTSQEDRERFEQDDSIAVERVADRTVAGTVTACYVFTVDDATSEQCFSPEGVPLYIQTTDGQQETVVEATSYTLSLPPNAFELPAQPGNMEDMMGGMDPSAWEGMY